VFHKRYGYFEKRFLKTGGDATMEIAETYWKGLL